MSLIYYDPYCRIMSFIWSKQTCLWKGIQTADWLFECVVESVDQPDDTILKLYKSGPWEDKFIIWP